MPGPCPPRPSWGPTRGEPRFVAPVMPDDTHETAIGRRVFLAAAAAGTAGVIFGSRIQGWLEGKVGPLLAKDPTGLLALLPIGQFRIYTVPSSIPDRSRAEYRLKVKGLVEHETVLTFDDLTAMPKTHLQRDF